MKVLDFLDATTCGIRVGEMCTFLPRSALDSSNDLVFDCWNFRLILTLDVFSVPGVAVVAVENYPKLLPIEIRELLFLSSFTKIMQWLPSSRIIPFDEIVRADWGRREGDALISPQFPIRSMNNFPLTWILAYSRWILGLPFIVSFHSIHTVSRLDLRQHLD